MDKSSRQKVFKETAALKKTLEHVDLIGWYWLLLKNTEEYTFLSSVHGTFSVIDPMLGYTHKSLNKFQKAEIISSLFSDHSGIYIRNQLQEISWKKLQLLGD